MVKIRLSRFGTKKKYIYRIVAVDSHKKGVGKTLEVLGYWNPIKKTINIDKEKIANWVKKGALMNKSVEILLSK